MAGSWSLLGFRRTAEERRTARIFNALPRFACLCLSLLCCLSARRSSDRRLPGSWLVRIFAVIGRIGPERISFPGKNVSGQPLWIVVPARIFGYKNAKKKLRIDYETKSVFWSAKNTSTLTLCNAGLFSF